jgi:cysteine desulfurase
VEALHERDKRLSALQARLEAGLDEMGLPVFGRGAPRVANTVYFSAPGIDGETVVGKLDRAGFAISSGSACSSATGGAKASPTLLAMGVDTITARGAMRVSLGRDTTAGDVDAFLNALQAVLNELKALDSIAQSDLWRTAC